MTMQLREQRARGFTVLDPTIAFTTTSSMETMAATSPPLLAVTATPTTISSTTIRSIRTTPAGQRICQGLFLSAYTSNGIARNNIVFGNTGGNIDDHTGKRNDQRPQPDHRPDIRKYDNARFSSPIKAAAINAGATVSGFSTDRNGRPGPKARPGISGLISWHPGGLQPPTPTSPTNGATAVSTSPTLRWNATTGATATVCRSRRALPSRPPSTTRAISP